MKLPDDKEDLVGKMVIFDPSGPLPDLSSFIEGDLVVILGIRNIDGVDGRVFWLDYYNFRMGEWGVALVSMREGSIGWSIKDELMEV